MTEETPPPTPIPPAAQPPYPPHPAPRQEVPEIPVARKQEPQPPAIGALGATLIGGAVAAAVGLLVALPLFRRGKNKKPKRAAANRRKPATRRKTTKSE